MSFSSQNAQFTLDLMKVLSTPSENLFYSPYSISSALHMLLLGAKGNSQQQLISGLGYSDQMCLIDNKFHQQQSDVISSLDTDKKNIVMDNANRLFPSSYFKILDSFISSCQQYYKSTAETLDYGKEPEASRKHINSWVEEVTKDKIKDLIPHGAINDLTVLVIANAIYFKANWMKQFKSSQTSQGDFQIRDGVKEATDFMHLSYKFNYVQLDELKAHALSLYYEGGEFRMNIFLPDQLYGIDELQKNLTASRITDTFRRLRQVGAEKVNLLLPKFKFEQSLGLNDTLSKLGMQDIFTKEADFSGIAGKPGDIVVSAVLHKAFIEVNEEGSEAAAATAVIMSRMMVREPLPPLDFKCDHPFLFFIEHSGTRAILFAGKFAKPAK